MEIEEVLKTDEAKEAIKAAAQELAEEQTKGLKTKNSELLGKVKSFQEQLDEIKEAKELAEQEAAEKSGDINTIKENLAKQHQKELDKLNEAIKDRDGKLHGLLIDNGLTDALTKAGVAPQHLDVVKAYIKSQHKAEITEQDGSVAANLDGKPLNEFVSEWSQGDQGKHYVAAADNSGGGANGANGGGKATGANKGDMGGDKKSRTDSIKQRFPDLN